MTKLKNPLFSFEARNTLASAVSFVRRRQQNIAEKKPVPEDIKSLAQLSWRHMYQKAVVLWHALSAAEKQDWESQARRQHMTGFAWFISQALKPNPGLYLPLQGGTMTGDIDMAKNRLLKLPLPTDSQEAASKTYVDTLIAAALYVEGARVYHNANVSIPHATWTTLPFNSERWDTDLIHDTVVNNSRLTCQTAGKYIIAAAVYFVTAAAGKRNYMFFFNGALSIATIIQPAIVASDAGTALSTISNLAIGDYVEMRVRQDSGGAINILSAATFTPEFMMQRIG